MFRSIFPQVRAGFLIGDVVMGASYGQKQTVILWVDMTSIVTPGSGIGALFTNHGTELPFGMLSNTWKPQTVSSKDWEQIIFLLPHQTLTPANLWKAGSIINPMSISTTFQRSH